MRPRIDSMAEVSLGSLLPLFRRDNAVSELAGSRDAVIALPEPVRAYAIAGIVHTSERHPIVVAVPSAADGERLSHDLRAFLGADGVDTFPAWETLPFERVSPSIESMGRRLRTMWRLRSAERMPRVLVAPIRALLQRLGPHVEEAAPIVIRPGDQVDQSDLI